MLRRFVNKFMSELPHKPSDSPVNPSDLRPDRPFVAIGDIHGRLDLLNTLLANLDTSSDRQLVFLGDYVDRGPDSAGVLSRLFDLQTQRSDGVICLMGNHERMMLDFLDDPLGRGAGWMRNGGLATLESYGIRGLSETAEPDILLDASEALEEAVPEELIAWMQALPLSWNSGNVWCVHAAMDPTVSPDAQRPTIMLWGHRTFLRSARSDGTYVVHGHTTVKNPTLGDSRIAIDTGAYRTGRLTAAAIAAGQCEFTGT